MIINKAITALLSALPACVNPVRSDGTISGAETSEIRAIAEELGFTRAEANSLRSSYRDKLAEFQILKK